MNKQNGITLIALIITIIVMLILVGVTINVALNGGLFDKAKTAGEQTQKQVEKEELITAMVGAYNSNGCFVPADVELPEGSKWCTEADESYTGVTQPQNTPTNWVITETGNKFYIDASGTVLDEKPIGVDDLVPTLEEKTKAIETEGIFYQFIEGVLVYMELDGVGMVRSVDNSSSYVWYCNDIPSDSSEELGSIEANNK